MCRKKRIRKGSNHLSTIYTIDSIPLLNAKYVDLNDPNIDYLFNDNCGLLRIECATNYKFSLSETDIYLSLDSKLSNDWKLNMKMYLR